MKQKKNIFVSSKIHLKPQTTDINHDDNRCSRWVTTSDHALSRHPLTHSTH